jgi:hypothetical protein
MPPFKASSSEDFSARSVLARDAGTDIAGGVDYDAQVANQDAHFVAFQTYQNRTDIEGRTSILQREQAQPGSINWRAQNDGDGTELENLTNQHEVTAPNPFNGP